jgi:hypothetical protein
MDNKQVIAEVIIRALRGTRLTQIRNIAKAHENTWIEMLNGNKNSQIEADKKFEAAIRDAVAELEDPALNYISEVLK